tara:strand:- start:5443 stop:5856 length:414 start_codon:yes stop_codon:yes gene_type:complete
MATSKDNKDLASIISSNVNNLTIPADAISSHFIGNSSPQIKFHSLEPRQQAKILGAIENKSYMSIEFAFDIGFVFPYEVGKTVLDALAQARQFKPNYNGHPACEAAKPVKSGSYRVMMLHSEEFGQMLLNYVLQDED